MSGFGSDNFAGVHPEVLDAIARANEGHAVAYGHDEWTARAEEAFRHHFGPDARAFPVFNGTAANVLSLIATCETWQAAICTDTAHLHVDECGAPERLAGVKLIPIATEHGKLDPDAVTARITRVGDQHAVQPRVLTISQATELGTVYTAAEVAALAEAAHEHGLLLHVDGARLANAAVHLDTTLAAITTEAGADVVSFGGTKNGLMLGEAVVLLNPELGERFEFERKQLGQLASKMRFVSAQLEALLEGDLWRRNAAARERDGDTARRGGRGRRRCRDRPSGRGQRRLPAPARRPRRAPARPPRRGVPLLPVAIRARPLPLDVRLGHDARRR